MKKISYFFGKFFPTFKLKICIAHTIANAAFVEEKTDRVNHITIGCNRLAKNQFQYKFYNWSDRYTGNMETNDILSKAELKNAKNGIWI